MRDGYRLVLVDRIFRDVVIKVYSKTEPESPYLPDLEDFVVMPA